MRAASNLAGVEFIDAPQWHRHRDTWREIITESGYFFSKDAMRFFGSRIAWESLTAYKDGYLFITSEQRKPVYINGEIVPPAYHGKRRYTVRYWTLQNGVSNDLGKFGEFCAYESIEQARRIIQQLTKAAQ